MHRDLNSNFEKLIKGQKEYKSSNLGFNLLISRLQRKYSSNSSQPELESCLMEMHAFMEKYKRIMEKDIDELKKN